MILDRDSLRTGLYGLVGFYNATNPDYPTLVPSLIGTRSGRFFNDAHSLIDIENIDQSIKNFSQYSYRAYSGATTYSIGQKVGYNGLSYEYINSTPSIGNLPTDVSYWVEIDSLSDYLVKTVYGAVDMVMDDWINAKKIRTKIKSIFDSVLLFNGVANYRNTVANQNNLVGLRLRMKKGERSLIAVLNKIGTQFTSTLAFNIYVYHSSQASPIATFAINHTKANSFQWNTLSSNNVLRYWSDDYDGGGDFYICYKQSDLGAVQALNYDINWHDSPCMGCNYKDSEYYQQYSPFWDVVGFEISESALGVGDTLWNVDETSISLTQNYGLNLNFATKCDIGYFVLQEEELFAEAIQYGTALKLLQAMAYNTRGGNQVAAQVKQEAKKELYHSQGVYGTVYDKYQAAIKALEFDLSGLNESCFPCDDGSPETIIGTYTLH